MSADESKARDPLWRFSLRSLLLLTAAIALILWAFISGWRLDDLIYLTAWFACVLVGIVFSRRGGWGIVLAIVLAAIVPTAGALAFHFCLYFIRRQVIQSEAFYPVTLLAAGLGGAMTAAIVVIAVVLYDRCSPPAIRRRIAIGFTSAIACVGITTAILSIRSESRRWRPTISIPVVIDRHRPAPPPMAFTPDGSSFALVSKTASDANGKLRIWNLHNNTERTLCELSVANIHSICFSSDGRCIAVVHESGISVVDTSTGNVVVSIDAVTANPWIPRNCCFSPDGKRLALCSYDGDVYKALVWDTSKWELRHQQELSKSIAQPVVVGDDLLLLAFNPGTACDLALLDVETLKPRHPPRPAYEVYRPLLSPDGTQVTASYDAWDLRSGKSHALRGPAYCLASGGSRFVTRRCDMKGHRQEYGPDWRLGIPIVRQWWRTRQYAGQIVLIDAASQQELCCSANYRGEWVIDACSSADGATIAVTFEPGAIRIWRAPD
jgi:hypothetical protein